MRLTSRLFTKVLTQEKVPGLASYSKSLGVRVVEKFMPDDADGYDKEEFDIKPRKNAFYYKYEINKYARQGGPGLRKALELFQEMKSEARLTPECKNFSPLIYGCAKAGYTKKAFELFEESLKYIRKPTKSMVTCLINACAESPFPEYGLKRLEWLLTRLKVDHMIDLNVIQYNATIKAYGKLGRLDEASRMIQEMLNNNVEPNCETFNMLLIGCASQPEAGCSFALRVFKRMKMYDYRPNLYTYRLLLRCIRDCGLGSPELIQETIRELPSITSLDQRIEYKKRSVRTSEKRKFLSNFEWTPLMTDLGESVMKATSDASKQNLDLRRKTGPDQQIPTSDSTLLSISVDSTATDDMVPMTQNHQSLPNLLSNDHLDLLRRIEAIRLDQLQTGYQRLLLFGGLLGYLETMIKDDCLPDSKTFSQLLCCIEPTPENHVMFYNLSEKFKIKRDILFYNLLIRNLCEMGKSKDRLELALDFVNKLHLDNLKPNITTYESLAPGCNDWRQARKLIMDFENSGFVLSDVLIGRLFHTAIRTNNFHYLNQLIYFAQERRFSPNRNLVDRLEAFRLATNDKIHKQEKELLDPESRKFSQAQIDLFDEFRANLGQWLKIVEIADEDHPWSQYHIDTSSKREGFVDYVRYFQKVEKVKMDALQKGERFGNLHIKAQKLDIQDQSN